MCTTIMASTSTTESDSILDVFEKWKFSKFQSFKSILITFVDGIDSPDDVAGEGSEELMVVCDFEFEMHEEWDV